MLETGVPDLHFIKAITEMRINAMLKENECERMLQEVRPIRRKLLDRVMIDIGNRLISTGEKLRERHAPMIHQCSKVCPYEF